MERTGGPALTVWPRMGPACLSRLLDWCNRKSHLSKNLAKHSNHVRRKQSGNSRLGDFLEDTGLAVSKKSVLWLHTGMHTDTHTYTHVHAKGLFYIKGRLKRHNNQMQRVVPPGWRMGLGENLWKIFWWQLGKCAYGRYTDVKFLGMINATEVMEESHAEVFGCEGQWWRQLTFK